MFSLWNLRVGDLFLRVTKNIWFYNPTPIKKRLFIVSELYCVLCLLYGITEIITGKMNCSYNNMLNSRTLFTNRSFCVWASQEKIISRPRIHCCPYEDIILLCKVERYCFRCCRHAITTVAIITLLFPLQIIVITIIVK